MTRKIDVDFGKLEKALALSDEWKDLGGGLYAAEVGKDASKALFESPRATGRDFIEINVKARTITAEDGLGNLDGLNAVQASVIKAAAGYVAGPLEKAAKVVTDELSALRGEKVSMPAGCTLEKQGQEKHFSDFASAEACMKGFEKVSFDFPAETSALCVSLDNLNESRLKKGAKALYLTTECAMALKSKTLKANDFRSAKAAVKAGGYDVDALARLATAAVKSYPEAHYIAGNASRTLFKRSKALAKECKQELQEKSYLSLAAWLFGVIPEDLKKYLEKAPAKPTAEAEEKPAAKRPKSKSRARLDASRKAVKEWKGQPADFSDFVKVINAGRKVPYSEKNCALLYEQSNGAATCVKGFQSWKAAGRIVKKGSKALIIEAPKMIKGTDKDGKEYEHLICTPVCVFDIAQTEVMKEA